MNKVIVSSILALTTLAVWATPQKQQVPGCLDKVRLISGAAAEKNHILLVNVGGAIPDADWRDTATYAASRLQINVWTNSVSQFDPAAYALDPVRGQRDFGAKAKVCVFIVDDPHLANVTGAPGCWCAVNVCNLKRDDPDRQTLRDRYAKSILRGFAYAAGAGASLEPMCSLFYGAVTLQGMDKTGIMIAPSTYFPMLEVLRAVGGTEMLSPAPTDDVRRAIRAEIERGPSKPITIPPPKKR